MIGISGTDYEPPVPDRKATEEALINILSTADTSEKLLFGEQEDSFSGMETNVPV